MEDSRLNIHKPLLSVRRFSSKLDSRKNENRKNENHLPLKPSKEPANTLSISDSEMNTGNVPFGWENSPGRPKNKQVQAKENYPRFPMIPPGRFFKHVKKDLDTNVAKSVGSSKKGSSEDSDEAYVDALDTLSRGETSFYNCSASGNGLNVKPSGNLPADPKMRDYMMGRFLPAAKAMASDAHVSQPAYKKNVVKEKPPEMKKPVNVDNKKLQLRYGPNFVDHENEEDDESDSDNDSNQHGNKSSKFCGLIPRFCSVNPVHGMCMRARLPISKASSSSVSSVSETDNEPARSGTYKRRSLNSVLESATSTEAKNIEGSKLYNRLQGPGVSVSKSFPSGVSEQNNSSSNKIGLSFKELLADVSTNEMEPEIETEKMEPEIETEKDRHDSMVEKTLYVDTVQTVKSPKEHSQSSFNESLEADLLGDDSKQCMKKGLRKASEGDQNLKSSQDNGFDFELLTPPPLPKSPSDSWLCRTLPSVSSKNGASRWNPKSPSTNTGAADMKSDQDQDNKLSFKKEPLNSIPEI